MSKTSRMKLPAGGRHGQSRTHLHRPKMSVLGKSAYAGGGGGPAGGPPMAFPAAPGGGGPAFGPPDMSGGAPAPSMGPGGGPPEM